jgi:hypothetical protein
MLTMPASRAYHVVMVCCQHHVWWALDAYYAGIMGSPCCDGVIASIMCVGRQMLTMPASRAYHVVMVCCQHHVWWALDAYYAGIMGSPCCDDLVMPCHRGGRSWALG